ncbi:MAG: Nif3-like dinuclear metal center hexameric protein [Gemmatimonadetes bacterium]|nr:Nif3-like dinuclear metal center hexameric protein [Gemmatimonadota bacterium]
MRQHKPQPEVGLHELASYLDAFLAIGEVPDYPDAWNGLQVEGPAEVRRICAAVDASEASIKEAVERRCDLLLVHHGLFWGGIQPLTGRRFRKVETLVRGGVALYSAHLPLDAHAEVGNCAVLARALDLALEGRFAEYRGHPIGWWGRTRGTRSQLLERVTRVVGAGVRLLPGGPEAIERVAVVTGAASGYIEDAARVGLDTLITGEGPHHTFFDAVECGVNVFYAGHYATETWGVQALARHVEERFGIPWEFIDLPTGF